MNRPRFNLFLLVTLAMLSCSSQCRADTKLIFISAFAPGEKGAIHAFRLDLESGELSLTQKESSVEHPFFLALSPNRKFLYSIHAEKFGGKDNEHVAAYRIVSDDGKLELINRESALGTAACYLDVDQTGKTVVVANYSTGSVASLPVKEDGSLAKAVSFVQHKGSSVNTRRQTAPHAHSIVVGPKNGFVYAADLGTDQVLSYRLDAKSSKLTVNSQPFEKTPAGAGPRHLTFHPNGKFMYVVNELTNSVTRFDYNAKSGHLKQLETISTLPKDFDGTSYCADLKITPDGRFLYATNRGHDSIASYEIAKDGKLSLLAINKSLGKGPQNLAITPNGKLLICANMAGSNVVVFRIDSKTGGINSLGKPVEMTSPSCIMIR
ncbi:MAG: 6-phosphogluconolactonase [Planctomycetaceae bacterium]|nr:6-phosphogluconolactonase [Planctomycetaceae bacterium]